MTDGDIRVKMTETEAAKLTGKYESHGYVGRISYVLYMIRNHGSCLVCRSSGQAHGTITLDAYGVPSVDEPRRVEIAL